MFKYKGIKIRKNYRHLIKLFNLLMYYFVFSNRFTEQSVLFTVLSFGMIVLSTIFVVFLVERNKSNYKQLQLMKNSIWDYASISYGLTVASD